ncbi:MAG: hypothetical protein WAV28_18750 [Sedimentisphaerales bacterium]
MAFLGPGQKPIVMSYYPHMLAEDVAVWTKFIQKMQAAIYRVWYDVHVGSAVPLPEEASQIELKVAAGITRKRIDCICHVGAEFWVIEVKPFGNMLALGQAYTYARLFGNEYQVPGRIVPVVVCDELDRDMRGRFAELGVMVFVNS